MATKKKTAKVVRKLHVAEEMTILRLETGVPMPLRIRTTEIAKKLTEIMGKMKVKQSFVIHKGSAATVHKVAKEKYPEMRIKCTAILPEKKFSRIFRIA